MSGVPAALLEHLLDRAEVGVAIVDRDLRFRFVNARLAAMNGVAAEEHVGRTVGEVVPALAPAIEPSMTRVLRSGVPVLGALVAGSTAGADDGRWEASYIPLETDDGPAVGAVVLDVSERTTAIEEARRRIRQQSAAADLGQRALAADDVGALLDTVCERLRDELDADFSGAMFLAPDAGELVMQAGAGWPASAMGVVSAPLGPRSHAGFCLMTGEPVVMRDSESEQRFEVSATMRAQGIRSAISTPIPGDDGPVGVLGVLARRPDQYDEDDGAFVRAAAHVIGSALRNDDQRRQLEALAAQRGRLVAQALEATEREQRAIADVLHDDVLQHLLSARLELSGGSEASLDRVLEAVTAAADLVRGVTSSIHPVTLAHAGLAVAVQRIAADHAARGRLEIAVAIEPEAEGAADRIVLSLVRELLTNVVRHAAASRASVSLRRLDGRLELRVTDDGLGLPARGLPRAADGDGLGLAYARERVEALGGTLSAAEGPDGRGTEILVVLSAGDADD